MASKPASSDDVDAAVDEAASAGAALSFTDFLERMKDPAATDLVRSIRACVFGCLRLIIRRRRKPPSLTQPFFL